MEEKKRDGRSFRRLQARRLQCPLCKKITIWRLIAGMRKIAGKCSHCGSILGYEFKMREETPGPVSKKIVYQISELGSICFRDRGRRSFESRDLKDFYN